MVTLTGKRVPPTREDLLHGISKISGHRQVLIQLNATLADDASSTQDIVALVRLDTGLTARVITSANSILFGRGLPVGSVEEAVIRVGVREIRRLLLRSITYELTGGALRSYGLARGDLWNRSLACALAMEMLARELKRSEDVCHTMGLMHGVGMIVIDQWLARTADDPTISLGDPYSARLGEREVSLVGYTNCEAGAMLLESWKFPESIVAVVGNQEAPLLAGRFAKMACMLVLARWQARVITRPHELHNATEWPDAGVMETAGFTLEQLRDLIPPAQELFVQQKSAVGAL